MLHTQEIVASSPVFRQQLVKLAETVECSCWQFINGMLQQGYCAARLGYGIHNHTL